MVPDVPSTCTKCYTFKSVLSKVFYWIINVLCLFREIWLFITKHPVPLHTFNSIPCSLLLLFQMFILGKIFAIHFKEKVLSEGKEEVLFRSNVYKSSEQKALRSNGLVINWIWSARGFWRAECFGCFDYLLCKGALIWSTWELQLWFAL